MLREQLLTGRYQPSAVRRHAIPKSGGGGRVLGIPTVVDRFLQQAILQVLSPRFDASFSQHSYGFRPGRSAHDAVVQAQQYVNEGRRIVVDVDLENFFDRVNHDVLMGRLAKRIEDGRLLGLVRRYLESGMMANGVVRCSDTRERRKVDRSRRCSQTCSWTKWTRSWRSEDTRSSVTPTTATSTCGPSGRVSA